MKNWRHGMRCAARCAWLYGRRSRSGTKSHLQYEGSVQAACTARLGEVARRMRAMSLLEMCFHFVVDPVSWVMCLQGELCVGVPR